MFADDAYAIDEIFNSLVSKKWWLWPDWKLQLVFLFFPIFTNQFCQNIDIYCAKLNLRYVK